MTEARLFWSRTNALLRSEALNNKWLQGLAIATAIFAIYWLTAPGGNPYRQYVLLADSLLHGRLYIPIVEPRPALELAIYGEKGFVVDPPAPALFLMPFVTLLGTDVNQVQISIGVGAAAMGLFWVAT